MYYALSLKDILRNHKVNFEFYDTLDQLHLIYVQNWFQQTLEDQMGMFTEIENHNYNMFEDYKHHLIQREYFSSYKKAA